MESQVKREVAYKVRIAQLHMGGYIKQDGWLPNYVQMEDGRRVSRVNIIGTVIEANIDTEFSQDTIVLDDGSASIEVRDFEGVYLKKIQKGNIVLLVGKVKEYNGLKYIIPEIVKELGEPKWVIYRNLEHELFNATHKIDSEYLEKYDSASSNSTASTHADKSPISHDEAMIEEDDLSMESNVNDSDDSDDYKPKFKNEMADNSLTTDQLVEQVAGDGEDSPHMKVIAFIRENDDGSGCAVELINEKIQQADTIIEDLLKDGEVFEIRPGILKVLE